MMHMPILLLLEILLRFTSPVHPYYVSVTEIEYGSRTGAVGVSCKVFTDDLEEALKDRGVTGVDLVRGDSARNAGWIASYMLGRLSLNADGKALALRFIGFENDPEATWCYFETTGVGKIRNLRVTSDILYETRKEQINIFHVTVDGERTSRRLVNPDRVFEASFK